MEHENVVVEGRVAFRNRMGSRTLWRLDVEGKVDGHLVYFQGVVPSVEVGDSLRVEGFPQDHPHFGRVHVATVVRRGEDVLWEWTG